MTGPEMVYEWKLGFDIFASGAAPGFTTTQVYAILNRAQDYIIDELYTNNQFDLFGSIIIYDYFISGGSASDTSVTVSLPSNYWKFISAKARVTKSAFSTTGIVKSRTDRRLEKVEFVSQDEFEKIDQDITYIGGDLKRYFDKPFATIYSSTIKVRGDVYSTFDPVLFLTYLKKRSDITASVDCELSEKIHRQVVDKAIDIAKTTINIQEPQSTKTQ